jgi:phasin family protein
MTATSAQWNNIPLNSLQAAIRFNQISLESAERLLKLGLEFSTQYLEQNIRVLHGLSDVSDPQEAYSRFNQLSNQSVEQALNSSRKMFEVMAQAQAELSELAGANVGAFNQAFTTSINPFGQNVLFSEAGSARPAKTSAATVASALSGLGKTKAASLAETVPVEAAVPSATSTTSPRR